MPMTFRAGDILKMKQACISALPRKFKIETPAVVSKAKTITDALKKINGLSCIKKGDTALIKPNINSDDNYPGTTRPEGLRELIKLLASKGAKIVVGDMSSAFWSKTILNAQKVGIKKVCDEEGVPLDCFEDSRWAGVLLPGTQLKRCWIPEELCRFNHIINLCVLKTHRMADFTLSMKNLMGCLHPRTRMKMHATRLKSMVGEFQSAINPCVNIIDGTLSFIDGGPDKGVLYESGIVLASRDRIALDTYGIELLKSFGSKSLKNVNPWKHPQILAGIRAGAGIGRAEDVKII